MQQNLAQKSFKPITIRPRSNEPAPSQHQIIQTKITPFPACSDPQIVLQAYCGGRLQTPEPPKLVVFRSKQKFAKEPQKRLFQQIHLAMAKARQDLVTMIVQTFMGLQVMIAKADCRKWAVFIGLQAMWMAIQNYASNIIDKDKQVKQESQLEQRESITRPFIINTEASESTIHQTRRIHRGTKPLTLVLDLDETLIHSSRVRPEKDHQPLIIEQGNGKYSQVFLRKRPHLNLFLEKLSEEFNLIIFTASHMKYADTAIDSIDAGFRISRRLYRQSCTRVNNAWVKDLTKLDTDLSRVIFIDNHDIAGSLQPTNFLTIKPWYNCDEDQELLRYMEILLNYAKEWKTDAIKKDVRQFVTKMQKEWKTDISVEKEL